MCRPIIGVAPLYDKEKDSYWMLPGYMQGLESAGAIPVMLPLTSDPDALSRLFEVCDGFLLTGGQDVSPQLYGEKESLFCGECCPARDKSDKLILEWALRNDKPILGICRGIQFMNVYFGGTLWQDLSIERPTDTEHHMQPPYNRAVHSVSLVDSSPLASILETSAIGVNSYHHQAIKQLAPLLREMARSDDGLIEAVYLPGKKFVWGVQWHPEFSYRTDTNSQKIFKAFVNAAIEK